MQDGTLASSTGAQPSSGLTIQEKEEPPMKQQSLYLQDVPGKGEGVFYQEPLSQDAYVTEYTGEVLQTDSKLFRVRCRAYKKTLHAYTYQMPLGHDLVIDTMQYGNFGRCMNHSHAPNCYT